MSVSTKLGEKESNLLKNAVIYKRKIIVHKFSHGPKHQQLLYQF